MHPIAFHVAGYPVRYAGLLYVVAVIVAWIYAHRAARRLEWDTRTVLPGVAFVVAAAYLGARLHGALLDWDRTAADPLRALLRPGSLSFFGGLALGSLALVMFLRWVKLPLGRAADTLTPVAPILYAIFRFGCFLNGDDYGKATSLAWGLSFPQGSPPTSTRVHPVQLYEVALMIPIWLLLRSRSRQSRADGALSFDLCFLLGTERFAVEFWRHGSVADDYLPAAQWFGLTFAAVGIAGRLWLSRRETQPL